MKKTFLPLLLLLFLTFISCEKWDLKKMACTAIPSAPTKGVQSPSQTQISWNWNTVAGATGYKYNTTNNYATATDNGASVSYTQTGLASSTPYTLYVWAYNSCGNSRETILYQTTSACPPPASPAAGSHFAAQTQIVWNWNTVAGATGYKYNTTNNYVTATDNGVSVSYTQTGLVCNTGYTLYVWAYNNCGNSTATILNQTTTTCPSPWTQKANFGGTARWYAIGFSIGTKGYIGTGYDGGIAKQDFWEWDQSSNVWTQKADFGGTARYYAVGFPIGTKGYIGTGYDGAYKQDFWEWDQSTNIWIQKLDFGGIARDAAVGFSIGTKGYIGMGYNGGIYYNDFWEWDQGTNIWTQKSDFDGTARGVAVGFSIGIKGYIGTGSDGIVVTQDFWEWDQAMNIWTQKANFGGTARHSAVGFSIGTKGYIGTGSDGIAKQDFREWDQASNVWTQKSDFDGTARWGAVGFSIGTKGYIGTGLDVTAYKQDFWEYIP